MLQFCWMGIFPWIKLIWHSPCSVLNKLGWLNWFWKFLCEGLSSFNPKRFHYPYAWSSTLCERRTSFWTGLISRKLSWFLLMFWTSFTSLCLTSFFYRSPSSLLCMVFYSNSCSMDEILSINSSTNVFVLEDCNAHHKDWLTYSSGTDRPGELL